MGYSARAQHTVSIGEVTGGILQRLVVGQNMAGERLLALSAEKVPLDESTLLQSGHVDPATDADEATEVIYDAPYAARWHEDAELTDSLGRHYSGGSNFQNGRESHYLTGPAEEHRDELVAIIRKQGNGG
jgi:hypothetical protein